MPSAVEARSHNHWTTRDVPTVVGFEQDFPSAFFSVRGNRQIGNCPPSSSHSLSEPCLATYNFPALAEKHPQSPAPRTGHKEQQTAPNEDVGSPP